MRTRLVPFAPCIVIVACLSTLPLRVSADVATWIGGTGNWTDAANWSTGVVPNDPAEADPVTDVVIDGDAGVVSVVTLTTSSAIPSYTNRVLTVTEGDSFTISYSGTKNAGGTGSLYTSAISNSGTITLRGGANGNGQHVKILCTGTDGLVNAQSGIIYINSQTSRNQWTSELVIPSFSRNDGQIIATQQVSDRNRVFLILQNEGVFENNGLVHIRFNGTKESTYRDNSANLSVEFPAGGSVMTFGGSGRIWLDQDDFVYTGEADIGNFVNINASNSGVLTNGVNHTIEGTGNINNSGLVNLGLVRAVGTQGFLSLQPAYSDQNGKPTHNMESGRMVAISPNGLYLGANNAKPSRVINEGLLEARTGSFIQFRSGATHSGTKSQSSIPAQFELGGTFAGGGEFHPPRPVLLTADATLAPGDLANTDGTGASTTGTLTFTTNLVLSAGTTLDFQFGRLENSEYDSVVVDGSLTLAGTLRVSQLGSVVPMGTYRIFTCHPGELTGDESSLTLDVAQGLHRPILSVDADAGTVDATFPPLATLLLLR